MIGKRIQLLRKSKKITQEEAAEKMGIVRSTYANYESGKREPDFDTTKLIADFYGVSVDYLLGRDSTNEDGFNDAETTIRLIKEEAARIGLSVEDPRFQKLLSDAFEMLRLARGKNEE
jgi:transcriptional regulator with XRE-family HTH domain